MWRWPACADRSGGGYAACLLVAGCLAAKPVPAQCQGSCDTDAIAHSHAGRGASLGTDPGAANSLRQPDLEISGIAPLMTGWHELRARTRLPEVAYVRWRVNGRSVPSRGPFEARLYFGQTPQPRSIEVLAYDRSRRPLRAARRSVNAGGLGRRLEFRFPTAGVAVAGPVRAEVCVSSPPHGLGVVELEVQPVGGLPRRHELIPLPGGACADGRLFAATPSLSGAPATLTARLAVSPESDPIAAAGVVEESIVVNTPPVFGERVDVRLIQWPVHVSRGGRSVTGLLPHHFELYEDGRSLPVREVLSLADAPLRIGLVFDWSVSTDSDSAVEARAAADFLQGLELGAQDSVFIAGIARSPVAYLPWTRKRAQIESALERIGGGIRMGGGSAFYDTAMQALYEFQGTMTRGISALILLSDGRDSTSRDFRRVELLAYAREAGVRIYPIAVHARLRGLTRIVSDTGLLERLAETTGGRFQVVEIDAAAESLRRKAARARVHAEELRRNPGDLARDPRFLAYLIAKDEEEAAALERQAASRSGEHQASLAGIRRVFEAIREDLQRSYLVVAEGRAERSGRFHPVEVGLIDVAHAHRHEVRAPSGLFW